MLTQFSFTSFCASLAWFRALSVYESLRVLRQLLPIGVTDSYSQTLPKDSSVDANSLELLLEAHY